MNCRGYKPSNWEGCLLIEYQEIKKFCGCLQVLYLLLELLCYSDKMFLWLTILASLLLHQTSMYKTQIIGHCFANPETNQIFY